MTAIYWIVLMTLHLSTSNTADPPLPVSRASTSNSECPRSLQEVCFGGSARYTVPENAPTMALGLLGPVPPGPCRNLSRAPIYSILHGKSVARVVGGELWSAPALDREGRPGPLSVEVSCTTGGAPGGGDVTYDRVLAISLLDRDDNLPAVVNVTATLDTTVVELLDLDSLGANSFEVEIVDDVSRILQSKLSVTPTEFQGLEATGIKLTVSVRSGCSPPETPYPVIVTLTDTNLPPPNRTRPLVQYPTTVAVSRAASLHARVVEPRDPRTLDTPAGPRFSLRHPAFNVTERAGIVYVADPTALQRAQRTLRLTVEWRDASGHRDSAPLVVEVMDTGSPLCVAHEHGDNLCSALEQRDCQRTSCAHGLGGLSGTNGSRVRCEWFTGSSPAYSTCTVDAAHCPDLWCDPLERLSRNLTCLQDCTTHVLGAGRVRDSGNGVQPLTSGTFCSCDHSGSCVCAGQPPRLASNLQKKTVATQTQTANVSTLYKSTQTPQNLTATGLSVDPETKISPGIAEPKTRRREGCGFKCQTKAAIGVIFIMSACLFFMLFLTARRQRRKSSSRKLVDTSNTLLEAQRAADTLLQTFSHPVVSPMQPMEPFIVPDPRWEVPRESLVIEQCLGEGEFGRVLKARAMDIDGVKGVTIVAVKTLKVNATSAEMADLLAEYQMMKDVCNPHVVRLLGACTSAGGPVYIIIEYAEHGSLRSYLRRSRLVPPAPGSPSQAVEPLSYKTLLTFAWQISKGMAYLAENKLVHRDLAARNVLLASGLLCKISDFGLSRDVYEDDAYFKRSKGRVPVKWMALESLADHVYTTKSDVWSYGVVLWELVTLGSSPYPGVAVHSLYPLLRAGYRMDRPLTCTDSLYELMLDCWREDPLERPPFWQIISMLEKMLEEGTDYLPLQLEKRLVINKGYLADFSPEDDIDILKQDFGYKIPNPQKVEKEINQKSLVKYANEMVSKNAEAYDNPRPLQSSSVDVEESGNLNNLGRKHYTVLRTKPNNQYQNDVQINIDCGSGGPAGEKESQYEVKKLFPTNVSRVDAISMSRGYVSMNRRASSLEAGTSSEEANAGQSIRTRPASYEDNNDVRRINYDGETVRDGIRNGSETVVDTSCSSVGTLSGEVSCGSGTVSCEVKSKNVSATLEVTSGNGAVASETVPVNGTATSVPNFEDENVADEINQVNRAVMRGTSRHSENSQYSTDV